MISVEVSDLLINGVAADSVTVVDGNTLEFGILSADSGETSYSVDIADGALTSLSGLYIGAYSTTFSTDYTAPQVTTTSMDQYGVMISGTQTLVFVFSEALGLYGLGMDDVSLFDGDGNEFAIATFGYDGLANSVSIGVNALPQGDYTLRLRSGDASFEDVAGNDLDGEGEGLPSGDGLSGGDYVFNFTVDIDTAAYPVPLGTVQPDGSLIYDPAPTGVFHAEGDRDDYTLDLEAGQVLTVSLLTGDDRLTGLIELLDIHGDAIPGASASAPGQGLAAVLQTIAIPESGIYTIRVSAERGVGGYELQALLNAAQEVELRGQGGWNETRADAQNIDGSFIDIDGGAGNAARGAVRGSLAGTMTLNVTVDGKSNIFSAGQADSFGEGLLPTALGFSAGAGNVFTFPDVTGLVSFGGSNLTVSADGSDAGSGTTDIASSAELYPGLSGIVYGKGDPDFLDTETYPGLGYVPGKTMFLMGVFLGDGLPEATPERLDFTAEPWGMGTDFTSLSPELGQTFFVGDGYTSLGDLQQFVAPDGATRIFLGFGDALQFGHPSDPAGFY